MLLKKHVAKKLQKLCQKHFPQKKQARNAFAGADLRV
jgi:hypothetical protein|tara:strand:- start:253 stop:363 length:111 start_codon:yes stop_codon:yes gene_type:complete